MIATGGTEFDVFTFDVPTASIPAPFNAPTTVTVDTVAIPAVLDVTTCSAPGCWHLDTAGKRLEVRVFAADDETKTIEFK
jgi:hypothetical protein